MTAKPWKQISAVTLRAAIVTGGTHSRIVRYVTHNVMADSYAVYKAKRGRLVRKLATGAGSPQDAITAGCAAYYEIDKPHLWRQKPER